MPGLTVVSAGAGTGKTYDICEAITDAISAGLHPARVLATTFTRKAAAELKGRLQERILRDDRFASMKDRQSKAELIELAAVGTVHSVGHQLLSRYAIHLGLSPRLLVLEEEGSTRCLHDLLLGMDVSRWEPLAKVARRLSIDEPQRIMLQLLDAKRSNQIGAADFENQLEQSINRLFEIMAPGGVTEQCTGFAELYTLARATLKAIEARADSTAVTRKAIDVLHELTSSNEPRWQHFLKAQKIEAGKKSGADQCLAELRAAASTVRRSPDLHRDIAMFVKGLLKEITVLEAEYERYKIERGLLDYTDLEVSFLDLLRDETLEESLRADFDLIVVDEFQDTNPIQLAIFQRLKTLGRESRWVGDTKQAIYGFRGTDPDLIRGVWDTAPAEDRRELIDNWRSGKGIVQIVSALFQPVLGDGAVQNAVRDAGRCAVERWVFQTKNKEQDAGSLATGIAQLRGEGVPLRDIAILCRTNANMEEIGTTLHQIGIPALLELPGLFSTREGVLTLCGLRLVADRRDSLAAATIMHLFEDHAVGTPEWLPERLRELARIKQEKDQAAEQGTELGKLPMPWHGHSRLAKLENIDVRTLSPSVVVQLVIDALDVGACLREWGDTPRRAAHVDAIVQLAKRYEEQALSTGTAATLSGLNAHFNRLVADGDDKRLAPHGLDAVTLLTYHRSKGLEWPIVVLTDLGYEREPDLWYPVVGGGSPQSEDPLAGRAIRYWPWPFGRNPMMPSKVLAGSALEADALLSPEGQQASNKDRCESHRVLYVGCTRARDRLILAHRDGKCAWLRELPDVDRLLPAVLETGEYPIAGVDTSYRVRMLNASMIEEFLQDGPKPARWLRALTPQSVQGTEYLKRYHSPSEAEPSTAASVEVEILPGHSIFPTKLPEEKEAALGNACHAYLSALPSMAGLDLAKKTKVALRILGGFAMEAYLPADDLVAAGERFRAWIDARYPDATWLTEVPITAPRNPAGQWSGSIDLLLMMPDGSAVIIDHKSAPIRREHCPAKAASYEGQLVAYRDVVESQEIHVVGVWIHFPLSGTMAAVQP